MSGKFRNCTAISGKDGCVTMKLCSELPPRTFFLAMPCLSHCFPTLFCSDCAPCQETCQDIHVICIALGGPRIFRVLTQACHDVPCIYHSFSAAVALVAQAGLRCGARKTPVRGIWRCSSSVCNKAFLSTGTVSEVTLSHGDTCALEGSDLGPN